MTFSLDDPAPLLVALGWAPSRSAARRLLENRALWIETPGSRTNWADLRSDPQAPAPGIAPTSPWPSAPLPAPCRLWLGKKRHFDCLLEP